jgi:hypothetical protein
MDPGSAGGIATPALMNMRLAARTALASALTLFTVACDTAEPPRPATASAASETEQSATAGATVRWPPSVRVVSASGAPVQGVPVHFAVTAGGGAVSDSLSHTDASGIAKLTSWSLGTTAGQNTVTATVQGLSGMPVTFRATGTPGAPARLSFVTPPPAATASGAALSPQPVLRVADAHGNSAFVAGITVTASAEPGDVVVEGGTIATDSQGIASFQNLALRGVSGMVTLRFSAAGLGSLMAESPTALLAPGPEACADPLSLVFGLGEMRRVTLADARDLACIEFDLTRNQGEQYLLLYENMPLYGSGATGALFSSAFGPSSPTHFRYTLRSWPKLDAAAAAQHLALRPVQLPVAPFVADHAWDFGAGPIYEIHPEEPPEGVAAPLLMRPHGQLLDINSTAANPLVGDTLVVRMEGIQRLGIPTGNQRAVIRHISDDLVIAEDVRLTTTLAREGGTFNTPLHPDTMAAIAREYARHAKQQGDLLFANRYNSSIEGNAQRVVAIHSVMYANNIWGYTYSAGHYFVWDYWVGTNGSTGGLNQRVQRNADNLFMHEIAHMREIGVLQQEVGSVRGNRWLVEGFARFTERLPIAARLLGSDDPSRTDNVRLPLNPSFGGSTYFRDDVPTFLNMNTSMLDGYQHSSYVFDYFADQVALGGGDWRAALRQFVLAAGRPATLDAVVNGYLGITFPELFTRARIALFLDDIGTTDLPPWTQYHQYRLRESRPAGSVADPRTLMRTLAPGEPLEIAHEIAAGAAWGYIIDGTQAKASTVYGIDAPAGVNAVVSITRIR